MKVLWFTNSSSNYYSSTSNSYNGGGWITSLEQCITKCDSVELAIAFFSNNQEPFCEKRGNVTYYPLCNPRVPNRQKLLALFNDKANLSVDRRMWPVYLSSFKKVVDDYSPDIIQVFGSEQAYGLISRNVDVPVVLHVQGVLNPYFNAFLPPFVSWGSYCCQSANLFKIVSRFATRRRWIRECDRENEIMRNVDYFIGRTEWDKRLTNLFNPVSHYYYGSEILRDAFYDRGERTIPQKLTIVSTISGATYKGLDVIIKIAGLLNTYLDVEYEWKIFGNINQSKKGFIEMDNNQSRLSFLGVGNPDDLRRELLNATLYVHPSYIDNSPNSVCEAQMLGVPVVASNVGGVSSLINNGHDGYLFPANDIYLASSYIIELFSDLSLNKRMGDLGYETACKRHSKDAIAAQLLNVYATIIKDFHDKK